MTTNTDVTRKKKPPIEHKDLLGQPLKVGDFVAVVHSNALHIASIIKLNPIMVKVKLYDLTRNGWYKSEFNRRPSDMILLDGEYLTLYLLSK